MEQRERRLQRTGGLCEHCLAATPKRISIAKIVNHKVPLVHGGSDDDDNTENLCLECDRIVTAKQFGFTKAPKRPISIDGWPLGD